MSRPENWISQALDVLSVLEFGFRKLEDHEIDFVISFFRNLNSLANEPTKELEDIGYTANDLSQHLLDSLKELAKHNYADLKPDEINLLKNIWDILVTI